MMMVLMRCWPGASPRLVTHSDVGTVAAVVAVVNGVMMMLMLGNALVAVVIMRCTQPIR